MMLEHLKARGMDVSLYPHMGYTEDEATFPLYNFGGKRTGLLRYKPSVRKDRRNDPKSTRYYTFIADKGEIGVFGLESLDFSETIYLVGGMFKAATLHRLGFASLHVSAVSYRVLKPQLRLLRRPYLAIGDNDDEGRQFARRYGGFTSPVDVDEMDDRAVIEMLKAGE